MKTKQITGILLSRNDIKTIKGGGKAALPYYCVLWGGICQPAGRQCPSGYHPAFFVCDVAGDTCCISN